ncbi:MAG: ABC transporter substrate-binding protein [Candidatus Hodarchaeota archaeon]
MKDKTPKNKKEAKKGFLANLTKNQKTAVGTIGVISIAGIIGGIFTFMRLPKGGKCIIGTDIGDIDALDPLICIWDEQEILFQVCESLFDNDLSGEKPELINVLATSYVWNENATELTVTLRQGVEFHDGTPFNAMAVKWNFDRFYRLLKLFPELLNGTMVSWGYLFLLPDGRGIVNETQVINDYAIRFLLNDPFVPFLQLLTHSTTSILSPTSTPANDIINLLTGELIGTGPFTYDSYVPHDKVVMSRNQNYWGKKANLDEIEFKFYQNPTNVLEAFLSKECHFLEPLFLTYNPEVSIEQFRNDPEFTVQETIEPNFRYIGMNNTSINVTMRKAISYAINYSYFITNVTGDRGKRARSPIPEGCLYSNTTAFDIPEYNITYARKLLKDAGWPGTENLTANNNVSAGNEWELKANSLTPLETYNFSYMQNKIFPQREAILMSEYLKQIGIKLNLIAPFHFEHMFTFGWYCDYNDPHNALYPIFIHYNEVELNDSLIIQWINDGAKETNSTEREQIYYNLQERLIEVLYPLVWTIYQLKHYVHVSNLESFQPTPYKTLLKNAYFK